ncbi:hypothetical protein E4U35_008493 [Claviceps purpurea]|nr:hypothetical protein E4U35_008493 [Claviceps purpurea]KAG6235420.1 hypothetical protein E4U24_008256 [Claviceps purpurea]
MAMGSTRRYNLRLTNDEAVETARRVHWAVEDRAIRAEDGNGSDNNNSSEEEEEDERRVSELRGMRTVTRQDIMNT